MKKWAPHIKWNAQNNKSDVYSELSAHYLYTFVRVIVLLLYAIDILAAVPNIAEV